MMTAQMTRSLAMTDKMLSRKEGGVGYVTFNNPEKLNAVSLDMWEATKRILDDFVADNDIRVVVLTGAGGKAFVSGADISRFESERPHLEGARATGAKLGLGYGYAGLKRLVDVVGPAFAKEIFYTARQFDAQEALTMGLVNRVVPSAELETSVKSITDMICANAPLTIKAVKYTVNEIVREDSKRNVARTTEMVEKCFTSNDYNEGRAAFMEKRKPVFTGT